MRWLALAVVLVACAYQSAPPGGGGDDDDPPPTWEPGLGAHWSPAGDEVSFRIASTRATRIELWLYAEPTGTDVARLELTRGGDGFGVRVPAGELPEAIYYGYRVWGPNWPYDPAWQPGTDFGWIADVDRDGNRMNPNKLVIDPYARELSHDPTTPAQPDSSFYATGMRRSIDSAPVAPKGVVLRGEPVTHGKPARPLRDDVIYEVHVRGFTKADAIDCAGTYAGAAQRAAYLRDLGITAIEFLPVQEANNDRNDLDPTSASGDNYWGYSTLAYFAPDRRYACDQSPGGPTREFRDMVRAFHAHDIKVFVDVVYNHTAEGGGGSLLTLRGIDNAGYYQLDRNGTGFTNSNGVGADVAMDKPLAKQLMMDSLRYWRDDLGVDGFRFDLAPVLGNVCGPGCFKYGPAVLEDIADAFEGVALIAEPWGTVAGSYQVGQFPKGWSEWNDKFRDTMRSDQNRVGSVTPGWLANRVHGSTELFRDDGRMPSASINYLVSHDGFTLRDLYACNDRNNQQPWPYGPSDGGTTNNLSWDHNGDAIAQRQAARTGMALLLVSAGVPMLVGGDELLHGVRCNNNYYNVDSPGTWLDWSTQGSAFWTFTQRLLKFRAAHRALHPDQWIEPAQVSWRDAAGQPISGAYMDDATKPVLAWRLDGAALADDTLYIVYNRSPQPLRVTLPPPPSGLAWYRAGDTAAWMEAQANFHAPGSEYRMNQSQYDLGARALAIFVAR
ncbi:MAG TPA: isoamylase [Kofleriaceae bacterium]